MIVLWLLQDDPYTEMVEPAGQGALLTPEDIWFKYNLPQRFIPPINL